MARTDNRCVTTTSSFLNRQTTQTSSHEKRNRLSSKCRFDGEWKRSTVVTRVSRQTNEIADGLAMRPEPARSLGRWLVRCHLCLDDTQLGPLVKRQTNSPTVFFDWRFVIMSLPSSSKLSSARALGERHQEKTKERLETTMRFIPSSLNSLSSSLCCLSRASTIQARPPSQERRRSTCPSLCFLLSDLVARGRA